MLATFLRDVGAEAAALAAIVGCVALLATFAQRGFKGVDRLFDWLQTRRHAALIRSMQPVVEGALVPLAEALQAHLLEEEALVAQVRDDFRAFVDRYERNDAVLWETLAQHGIDRRSS